MPSDFTSFSAKIDCMFPFGDTQYSLDLVSEALNISHEAVFRVVEEIARSDHSKSFKKERLLLLEHIKANCKDITLQKIVFFVRNDILGEKNDQNLILTEMASIRNQKSMYTALNILYFLIDDDELGEKADIIYNQIIEEWNSLE